MPIRGLLVLFLIKDIKIYADNYLQDLNNFVVGANEDHYHYINVNIGRDFDVTEYVTLEIHYTRRMLSDGSGVAQFAEGIEVGQVFKLGTKYSESMNATFLDNQGKAQPLIMGCYGIGVSRTLSAIVEQNNDEWNYLAKISNAFRYPSNYYQS